MNRERDPWSNLVRTSTHQTAVDFGPQSVALLALRSRLPLAAKADMLSASTPAVCLFRSVTRPWSAESTKVRVGSRAVRRVLKSRHWRGFFAQQCVSVIRAGIGANLASKCLRSTNAVFDLDR